MNYGRKNISAQNSTWHRSQLRIPAKRSLDDARYHPYAKTPFFKCFSALSLILYPSSSSNSFDKSSIRRTEPIPCLGNEAFRAAAIFNAMEGTSSCAGKSMLNGTSAGESVDQRE